VDAYALLLEKQEQKAEFSEYEIGSGEAVSIREFVETAKKIAKAKTELVFGVKEYREHEIMFSQANIEALKNIGWEASMKLTEGIAKCL
jgi:CDP-paratose synthetase